jgi:hypothetical protein
MHHPIRIVSSRPDRTLGYYVLCTDCAQLGEGRILEINGVEQGGVIYGPISEMLADSLLAAHAEIPVPTK